MNALPAYFDPLPLLGAARKCFGGQWEQRRGPRPGERLPEL